MLKTKPHEYAKELLSKSDYSIPIDVRAIAEREGIHIEEIDLEPSVSGFLIEKDGVVAIGINKNHNPSRQRFTIAHELGHFISHEDNPRSNFITKNGAFVYFRDEESATGTQEHERYANQIAADILMPKDELKKMVSEPFSAADDEKISRLAQKFEVSFAAMSIRLSVLKLVY